MSQSDLDPDFIQGLRLLHSSNKDTLEQLRALLDDKIKQKIGASKMLSNVLQKKYTMEEPVLSDHSSCSSKKSKSSISSKHSDKSSKSNSPDEIVDMIAIDDPLAEILEDDLTCVVCKGMDVGARNRLVECGDCHSLYHQECHTPTIQDTQIDVPKLIWYCSNCIKAHQPPKDKGSPKPQADSKKDIKKSSSKHSDKHKSSSSHSNTSDSSISTSQKVTPTINIIGGRSKESSSSSSSSTRSKTKDKRTTSNSSKYSSSSKNSSDKSSHKSKANTSD